MYIYTYMHALAQVIRLARMYIYTFIYVPGQPPGAALRASGDGGPLAHRSPRLPKKAARRFRRGGE